MWIPMDKVFDLGIPGPSGNENDTYVTKDTIFKVNNLLNSGSIYNLLDKIILHNLVFPNTAYKLIGFAGYDGRSVMPVLEQERRRSEGQVSDRFMESMTCPSDLALIW